MGARLIRVCGLAKRGSAIPYQFSIVINKKVSLQYCPPDRITYILDAWTQQWNRPHNGILAPHRHSTYHQLQLNTTHPILDQIQHDYSSGRAYSIGYSRGSRRSLFSKGCCRKVQYSALHPEPTAPWRPPPRTSQNPRATPRSCTRKTCGRLVPQ